MKIIIDLETTGFKESDDILQISVIKLDDNNKINFIHNNFFKTDKYYPEAYVVHGLLKEELSNSPWKQSDLNNLITVLFNKVDTIIGYNTNFDYGMLFKKSDDFNKNMLKNIQIVDMMRDLNWYKKSYNTKNGRRNNNLRLEEALSEMINKGTDLNQMKEEFKRLFKIQQFNSHDARWDTYVTYVLYRDYYLK